MPHVADTTTPASWTPTSDDAFHVLHDEVKRAYDELRTARVAPLASVEQTARRVDAIDFDQPVGLTAATREAAQLMRDGDLRSSSARCFGFFNPTAAMPGVVADALAAARNPQNCVVTHATASVSMERHVIAWLLERIGLPKEGTGNFTSGGSEANATALLVALVRANADYADDGIGAFEGRPTMYTSADCHLAWIKIARAAGMGSSAVRLVPTSGDGRMDPTVLRAMVAEDRDAGRTPIMIAPTAGTTNAGELDPIPACRSVADEFDLHLHVDAAWAGALIVDPERRPLLDGIELADSVTIDAHKWLSVPMGAGMFFARDAKAVSRTFAVSTSFMPTGDGQDAYVTTNQWSRRFIGLRLWMILRATGAAGYARMFDRQFALADLLRERLVDRGWTVRNGSPLPVVLFDDAKVNVEMQAIANELEADGQVWLGCVSYEGRKVLRACMTSFLSEPEDVELLLDRLDAARQKLSR